MLSVTYLFIFYRLSELIYFLQTLVTYSFSTDSRKFIDFYRLYATHIASDLAPVYFSSLTLLAWYIPHYTPTIMNHLRSWTHQALTCILHPAYAHAALCAIGLAISGYPSELSGMTCSLEKAFLAQLYNHSSCPLPWMKWFRCSSPQCACSIGCLPLSEHHRNHMIILFIGLSCLPDYHFHEGRGILVHIPSVSKSTQCLEGAQLIFLGKTKWMN